ALPLGVLAAVRRGTALDRAARLASLSGACLPSFWLGPLLMLAFSIRLGWLPVAGRGGLAHLVLPAVTLGLGMAGILGRLTRAGARAALAGVTTLVLLALAGAVAPWLAPAGPYAADLTGRLGPPSDAHLFGQDTLGRDVLARVLYGARISLGVGAATVVLSLAAGTLLGCVAGYAGGWVDEGLARVIDVLLAFPGLLLAIALAALRGPS